MKALLVREPKEWPRSSARLRDAHGILRFDRRGERATQTRDDGHLELGCRLPRQRAAVLRQTALRLGGPRPLQELDFKRRAANLNSAPRPFSRLRKCCGKNWKTLNRLEEIAAYPHIRRTGSHRLFNTRYKISSPSTRVRLSPAEASYQLNQPIVHAPNGLQRIQINQHYCVSSKLASDQVLSLQHTKSHEFDTRESEFTASSVPP